MVDLVATLMSGAGKVIYIEYMIMSNSSSSPGRITSKEGTRKQGATLTAEL